MPHSTHEGSLAVADEAMPDTQSTLDSSAESKPSQDSLMQDAERSPIANEDSAKGLEDMFDGDDLDEDIPPSSGPAPSSEPGTQEPFHFFAGARFTDTEVMRAFYQRLFPFRYLFQWLNHSPSPCDDFAHREFAFTLPNDAYLRYQSFQTADLLRKQCVQMVPSRFEIGPVYSTNPRARKSLRTASAFRPLAKELVFDIDMTDYDDIRTCCSGANICNRCWSFITMSIKVVDTSLREDFGFKHILWVYSGRRGAHAWVCDKRAREMDDQKRKAVAGYLELLRGGDSSGKRVNIKRPLHPHLERSLKLLRDPFQTTVLREQNPWSEDASHLLALLPDKTLTAALTKKWDSAPSRPSAQKWADIDALATAGALSTLKPAALKDVKIDIVLEYTYPRLDAEVSKKLNHLLKSPFCVHPGTGRICVPIDPRRADEFDPLEVPTVTELLGEIDEWGRKNGGAGVGEEEAGKKLQDWEKTRLKGYVDYFKGFVAELLKEESKGKREREEVDGMEF